MSSENCEIMGWTTGSCMVFTVAKDFLGWQDSCARKTEVIIRDGTGARKGMMLYPPPRGIPSTAPLVRLTRRESRCEKNRNEARSSTVPFWQRILHMRGKRSPQNMFRILGFGSVSEIFVFRWDFSIIMQIFTVFLPKPKPHLHFIPGERMLSLVTRYSWYHRFTF